MSQDNLIKVSCTVCRKVNYYSHKNKKTLKNRIELQKFCSHCGKHTKHKESK
ncbi:MAG: 50S ribosomal protein L33 [Patescibacteria group bacterium]|nr:50S ribosomal protein L33 [Patescibacteria group bacterium]